MSRLDKLLEAERNGVTLLGQERDEVPVQPSLPTQALPPRPVPITPPAVETPKTLDELPQEVLDYAQEMSREETPEYGKGMAWSLAAEIGGGIGGSLALSATAWGKKGLEALRAVKNLGKVGFFTPEGGSTVGGAALMLGAEGAIWGLSNYIGQTIREEYGIQDHYSVGEGIAATVFGLTPIYRGVGMALKLPESPLAGIGFKSREMATTTGKVFVQGAVIGMAETALRQEIQLMLNEREDRNPYEYLLASTIGGTANVGFTSIGAIWSRTGKWGRGQATEAVTRAQENLRKRREEYQKLLDEAAAYRSDEGGYVNPARQESLTGGYQRQTKLGGEFFDETTAVKQMEQLNLAEQALDDVLEQIVRASKAADKRKNDLMPSKITTETLEAPLPKAPKKDIEADAPTPPKTPTKEPTPQPEGDEIDALTARLTKVNKDNMTLELPDIAKAGNVIREKHVEGIEDGIRILAKKGNENDRATLESLIDHVRNLNRVETQVLDTVETTFGRTGQGLRKDAERFKYVEEYSKRARDSKQTLDQLEKALQKRLEGAEVGDLSRLLDEYTSLKPRKAAENEAVRKRIKQREKDLEKLTPEKLAAKEAKEIKKLEAKLEKLRKQFGDDATIKPQDVARKPQKTKEIEDLKARIKDHQAYRRDAIRLGERLRERERLLAVETGPLGAQRAEVSKKPTGPKKTPGRLEQVEADIAFLKKNMRNRVQEIDKAAKEMKPEFQAEQIRKTYLALGNRLEKELNEYRARFGDMDALEARTDAPAKPTPEKPQDIKDKEELLKFYRDAEAEALKVVKLEKELARIAEVEGRGIMGAMRAETAPKPKGPTKPSRSAELKEKIQQSKSRMRVRIKQIDKAQAEILKDREMSEIYKFYERTFNDAMNKDKVAMFVAFNRWANQARQIGLINQFISVTAGVATNVLATFKQFFRGGLASVPLIGRIKGTEILSPSFLTYKISDKLPMSVARANARADAYGAWMALKDRDGLLAAMKRTFMENVGTTTGQGGKFSDEVSQMTLPRGINALVARAHKNAERRALAAENVGNAFSRLFETKNPIKVVGTMWLNILSPGVRGIQTVDEMFRRQLIKGQIWADATKEAIADQVDPLTGRLVANFDSAKAERQAIVNYNAAWKDNDGIAVLKAHHQYKDAVDNINQELLFAANAERVDDLIEPLSEPFVRWINSVANDDTTLTKALRKSLLLGASPYVGVPTRAGYRSAHYTMALTGLHRFGKSQAYSARIKEVEAKIKANEESLRTNDKLSEVQKSETMREIRDLQERLDVLVIRRARQNREDLTDMLFSWSLISFGMYMASEGGEGSLDWMSAKQRKDSKRTPFTWNGVDYRTASPYSMAMAFGANYYQWSKVKDEQTVTGVQMLEKDLLSMLASTFITVNLEQPFLQGLKQTKEMAQAAAAPKSDTYAKERGTAAAARFLSSYFSIVFPTQAKKIVERITTKGVADFRGGSFQDRLIYGAIGLGPANIKTDRLGEPMADNKTWLNQNLWRLFPSASKEATEFEKIERGVSLFGALSDKPTQLKATGVRMVDWIDEEGFSLASTFDQLLRKRRLSKEVERLVKDRSWQSSFKEGWIPEGDKYTNEAMTELNEVLREAWNETADEILSDSALLKRFVNKEGKNLYEHLEKRETQEDTPTRVRLLQDIIENN